MYSWSLVCFTLLIQSAVGLVWIRVAGRWFSERAGTVLSTQPMVMVLILVGLGLLAAMTHLARPRLAPNALRNLASSWLSREVFFVPVFGGAVALIIFVRWQGVSPWLMMAEAGACLLGGAALWSMSRVYGLKTVPAWNTPATPLEFAGTTMLLGGSLGVIAALLGAKASSPPNPALVISGIGVVLGLMLKLAALAPTLEAEKAARRQTWYEPEATFLSTGRVLVIRTGLNLAGALVVLLVLYGCRPIWLWAGLCLICIGTAEVMGRVGFYKAYQRIGV